MNCRMAQPVPHADLFRQIDRLVDTVLVAVLAHLILYDGPISIDSYSEFAES